MNTRWLSAAACAAMIGAAVPASAEDAKVNLASPRYGSWGIDLGGRNTAVKPGDDFYRYGNGVYLDKLTIPSDRARFGNFDVLAELSQQRVRAILEETAAATPLAPTTEADKTGAFYKAFMDEARIEQLGAKPLARDLRQIRRIRTHKGLARLMGTAASGFDNAIFGLFIDADQKDPDKYVVYASQAGLGMPDRDYYLSPQFATQKAGYQAYVERLLTLIGWPDAKAEAEKLVAFETRIAEASWTRVERRDAEKTYNPTTVADLEKSAPGFPWRRFLRGAGLSSVDSLVVSENTAFPKIAAVYAETPLSTLKTWAAFSLADNASPYLSKDFVEARFTFRNKTLSGQPELQARWKRAVNAVQGGMGEAIGRVYVARWFTPEAKAKMDALVGELKVAMKGRIEGLTWMGADTKAQALSKLDKFTVKIGYPSKWRDYSGLVVRADDLYGDVERSTAFEWRRQVKRLKEKVDRTEWGMTPQTVNAYYNPPLNEIVFPAAILQAPFFDPDADPAVNYGGIGGVIGHEMTHGFDDQGRKYDGSGRLTDWWTADDAKKFEVQATRLGAQYSAFEPLPGAKVNGDLTMGENIADLGGLLLALDAYHLSLKGKPAPVIDGVTGDQRVLLGWAQVWRQKQRDESLRQQTVADPHSPAEFRVNGVVRNIDAWYQAFGVSPSDKLYVAPDQRVRIW